jgi:hypothetical protein
VGLLRHLALDCHYTLIVVAPIAHQANSSSRQRCLCFRYNMAATMSTISVPRDGTSRNDSTKGRVATQHPVAVSCLVGTGRSTLRRDRVPARNHLMQGIHDVPITARAQESVVSDSARRIAARETQGFNEQGPWSIPCGALASAWPATARMSPRPPVLYFVDRLRSSDVSNLSVTLPRVQLGGLTRRWSPARCHVGRSSNRPCRP